MRDLAARHAGSGDYFVLSGSLPPGCPADFYRSLIEAAEGMNCRCVLDADGDRLRHGLRARPFLIKPNRYELEMLLDGRLNSIQEVRDAARTCIERGVQVVAVSMGEDGAMIVDGEQALYAPRIPIEVKSTVAAGDSMVAGLVSGFRGGRGLEDTFRLGVACATARCMTAADQVVEKSACEALLDRVEVKRL